MKKKEWKAGDKVQFHHMSGPGYPEGTVQSVTVDGNVIIDLLPGEFAPHLFTSVESS